MKKLIIVSLLAGQLLVGAQSVAAADFAASEDPRFGMFGGVRLSIPLDGNAQRQGMRAGFALAPVTGRQGLSGAIRSRIGEGVEIGYRANRPLSFSIAGQDLGAIRSNAAQDDNEQRRNRRGPSTVGWIAIGLGAVAVVAATAAVICIESPNCGSD